MTAYKAITKSGRTKIFTAMTYSDAYQQACDWAGSELIDTFSEL